MASPPELFTLVEGELYAWKVSQLGESAQVDAALSDLLFAVARLASDFPLEAGSATVRAVTSRPMLRENGEVIRLIIRFVAREERGEAELLDVETMLVPPGA